MIGRNKRELHQHRAQLAWPILAKRANSGGPPFTYKEIGEPIGVHWRVVGYFLGEIQSYCKKNKLPPLQAMVVRGSGRSIGLPGTGYHGSARNRQAHDRALAAVYSHKWPSKPPAFG